MPSQNDETGITNLGRVPPGMTFEAATLAAKPQRKYTINPNGYSHRLTLCDTLRHLYRMVDSNMPEPQKIIALELLAAAFDYGKRMDARMKELKSAIPRGNDNG